MTRKIRCLWGGRGGWMDARWANIAYALAAELLLAVTCSFRRSKVLPLALVLPLGRSVLSEYDSSSRIRPCYASRLCLYVPQFPVADVMLRQTTCLVTLFFCSYADYTNVPPTPKSLHYS